MRKNILLLFVCLSLTSIGFAQENVSVVKNATENIYTPLKPADGLPYIFGSKQELEIGVPAKKNKVKEEIKKNETDAQRVIILRWELWRLENAIVIDQKSKN